MEGVVEIVHIVIDRKGMEVGSTQKEVDDGLVHILSTTPKTRLENANRGLSDVLPNDLHLARKLLCPCERTVQIIAIIR